MRLCRGFQLFLSAPAGKTKELTPTRKRPLKERNGDDEEAEVAKPKRRRIIIPSDSEGEDSEDDYKPGKKNYFLTIKNSKIK